MKRLLTYILTICMVFAAFSQLPADSVKVYFRLGNSQFDPSLRDNSAAMSRFVNDCEKNVSEEINPTDRPSFSNMSDLSVNNLSSDSITSPSHRYFALKTNMLYDAALIPNIGFELYTGKKISVYGQWMYAWWDNDSRHRYWRIYGGDLGARWFFGSRAAEKPLSGHHMGIYGGVFIFDFEWGDTGYMGGKPGATLWDRCLVNAGIEYGYSLPIGRRLNLDFSIGIGYFGGKYIKYFPFNNEYYREKEYKLRFFGPTKAEVSLVWLIGRGNTNNRKGGEE